MNYKESNEQSFQQSQEFKTINQERNQNNQNHHITNIDIKIWLFICIISIIFIGTLLRFEQLQYQNNKIQSHPLKQQITQSEKISLKSDIDTLQMKQQLKSSITLLKFNYSLLLKQQKIYKLQILPQLIIPQSQKIVTAVFTTCCNRYDLLQKTLNSFFQQNTYTSGLQQVIIVNDGPDNDQLNKVKQKWLNLTWISTGQKVGQIEAIDIAYNQVKTPFIFHVQDDWLFILPGFIQIGFDYFERIPNLLQTWIKVTRQKVNQQTRIVQSDDFGFSFNPGLKKLEHYKMLNKGYKWITKNISFKIGAGKAQGLISRYYKKKGFVVAQTQHNYIEHIGQNRSLPKASY